MIEKLADIESRYEELQRLMAEHAGDYARVAELSRERSEIEPVVQKFREYKQAQEFPRPGEIDAVRT